MSEKQSFTRRQVLAGVLGGAAAGAILVGCGNSGLGNLGPGGGPDAGGPDAGGPDAAGNPDAAAGDAASDTCTVTPEGEIGPYFADDSADGFNRSDITANIDGTETQDGIPLTLTFYVYDSEQACAPVAGAQVDIWHCNAEGVYSDQQVENTTGKTWLRGYQLTDATGKVTFQTVMPGWYQGRATHIHLRIRSSYSEASSTSDGTNTTQIFFPQALVDMLSTSVAPYDAEGKNPTTNAGDHVYSGETRGSGLMSPTGDAVSGYSASYSFYLPITS